MTDYAWIRSWSDPTRTSNDHEITVTVSATYWRDINGQSEDAAYCQRAYQTQANATLYNFMSDMFDAVIAEGTANGYTVTTARILSPYYLKSNSLLNLITLL